MSRLTLAGAMPWLAVAALWLLLVQYSSIDHDSLLYSFQAIARQHPELYGADLYLRFGSQDNFTAFSSIYGQLVGWLGVEGAAAWTTFVAIIALQFAVWLLARRLVPPRLALMGLALLIVLPGWYGPYTIFRVVEPFITPRMPAEALAIGSIISVLAGHHILAAVLIIASAGMHPLMAAPALFVVLYLALAADRRWLLVVAAIAGLALLAIAGSLSLVDPYRIDADWMVFFESYAAYLFLANWGFNDWMQICPGVLTLLLGARLLGSPPARHLCAAVLLAAAFGLAFMFIGADWLRIAFATQCQGYRALWLVSMLSLILLPAVALQLWRRGTSARAAALLLAALWFGARESFGPTLAITAALAGANALRDVVPPAYRRWLLVGASLALLIAASFSLAERVMISSSPFAETFTPGLLEQLRYLFVGGLIPVVALMALFALARTSGWQLAKNATALLLLAACVALVPSNLQEWSRRHFDGKMFAAFESWRALIPRGSEVVWIEKPEFVWFLLERPSYYSTYQSMSGVFSRTAAPEILAREAQLVPFMKADEEKVPLSFVREHRKAARAPAGSLAEVCADIDANFIVARGAFRDKPLAVAPTGIPATFRAMKLYRCEPPTP